MSITTIGSSLIATSSTIVKRLCPPLIQSHRCRSTQSLSLPPFDGSRSRHYCPLRSLSFGRSSFSTSDGSGNVSLSYALFWLSRAYFSACLSSYSSILSLIMFE
ncbi:hypothetical protein EUGRSUZ_C04310 [Eucalyptus grandis]|uniref:Uncharacterized protein n=2 Tax=Eucalyptus grandis TaxID=71139 RepID=A0A059CXM1_EUCGR|nr:hypothetical protein EUGRSUZ_C04310 [Eucalyptus grandis]